MKKRLTADATGVACSVVAPHGSPVAASAIEAGIVDEALAPERRDDDGQERDRPKRDDVIKWLRNQLTHGPRGAKEVMNDARAAGFSVPANPPRPRKSGSPIDTYLQGFGPTGTWVWRLRDAQRPDGGPDREHFVKTRME